MLSPEERYAGSIMPWKRRAFVHCARPRPNLFYSHPARLHPRPRTMAGHTPQPTTASGALPTNRKYVIWGLTLITGGLIAYSFYNLSLSTHSLPTHHRLDSKPSKDKKAFSESITRDSSNKPRSDDSGQTDQAEASSTDTKSYLPDWSAVGDKIKDAVVPDWAEELPGYFSRLQRELSEEDDSLAAEIWREAHDPRIHPEIEREAQVRVSNELCEEEQEFIRKRRRQLCKSLAKYLDLPESEIHPDDVPVIGMCGSGGGLRAMVAGSSSYLCAEESGLFDCAMYTAGVSGSCWLQTLYHSTLTNQNFGALLNHLKSRISTHIAFPPPVLKLVTNAPTHKYLLAGGFEKHKGMEDAEFGVVDVYGLLLGARLMVPKGELDVDPRNLKLSNQRRYLEEGQHPMPIYTAVRHEVPSKETVDKDKQEEDVKDRARKEAWFQWFEFTPYELWCEELASGIPTWSLGRIFSGGKSQHDRDKSYLPETRIPLLQGIWGSAFCATLSHYYKEIRPLVKGLTGFGGVDKLLEEHNDDLIKVHPVAPSQIPNYAANMNDQLPERCPDSIHDDKTIQLMDAGMSNNLPIYPLLRPGREIDVLIAFDASADVKQDNWLRVADGYARQRGIKGWPVGTGWSEDDNTGPENVSKALDDADNFSPEDAKRKLSKISTTEENGKEDASQQKNSEDTNGKERSQTEVAKRNLGYCTVWVGTTEERTSDAEPPQSKVVEGDWELMQPNAGIALVYFPFMANEEVPGVDPEKSDFLSTWNFIYTPEQVDKVVALARANFKAGEDKTKMTVRAVYERKKRQRLDRKASG